MKEVNEGRKEGIRRDRCGTGEGEVTPVTDHRCTAAGLHAQGLNTHSEAQSDCCCEPSPMVSFETQREQFQT
jgi:hypothetical protein